MKPRTILISLFWIVGLLLAWRSGPWNGATPHDNGTPGQHDANFHMHRPLHNGGKVSMAGQFHLELVSESSGTHRMWISNAFRQEMDPAGFRGRITIESASGDMHQVDFHRAGRGKELVAQSPPLSGQVWLTVQGHLGQLARFDEVKFFWDYNPESFQLGTPLGLDSMLPIPADNHPTVEKVALGRDLFFDPALSADGTMSCATCHRPEHAYAENVAVTQGIASRSGRRNTPTLLNVGYLESLFWDGRSSSLEEQAIEPILDHAEMGNSNEAAFVERLEPKYGRRMQIIFRQPLSLQTVSLALASFERVLLSGDSDFDRHEAGRKEAMSQAARRGRALFFGRANCGSCHIPPLFTDFAFHNLGIGWRDAEHGDLGRREVTGKADDTGRFKTPSLRDVTLTAPYMHDGSLATLRDVIEFYNQGGHVNSHLDPRIKALQLSATEVDDLLAFLSALEGRSYPRTQLRNSSPSTTSEVNGE